jgi:hypothetical protein
MEGHEVQFEDRVEQDEAKKGENTEERKFRVGELVELWEGTMVRGYTTDGGDPAWVLVKVIDYGGG